jgi:sialate O-acetylesterase
MSVAGWPESPLQIRYEHDVPYSGPVFRRLLTKGNEARLRFDHVEAGLIALEGELKGFEIAGRGRHFVRANAWIDGDEVVVWSEKIKNPAAVRYGWADNPVCNLYNKAGLPASPFRTDDWPGITVGRN